MCCVWWKSVAGCRFSSKNVGACTTIKLVLKSMKFWTSIIQYYIFQGKSISCKFPRLNQTLLHVVRPALPPTCPGLVVFSFLTLSERSLFFNCVHFFICVSNDLSRHVSCYTKPRSLFSIFAMFLFLLFLLNFVFTSYIQEAAETSFVSSTSFTKVKSKYGWVPVGWNLKCACSLHDWKPNTKAAYSHWCPLRNALIKKLNMKFGHGKHL